MTSTFASELMAMREELGTIARAMAGLEARFEDLTARAEEETSSRQSQAEDMEARIRHLELENAVLERDKKRFEPQIRQVVDARNDAYRRLRHTRKVVKDIIEERKSGVTFDSPGMEMTAVPRRVSYAETSAQGKSRLTSSTSSSSSRDGHPTSPETDRTARQHAHGFSGLPSSSLLSPPPPRERQAAPSAIREKYGNYSAPRISGEASSSKRPMEAGTSTMPTSGVISAARRGSQAPPAETVPHGSQGAATSQSRTSLDTSSSSNKTLQVFKRKGEKWSMNNLKGPRVSIGMPETLLVPDVFQLLDIDSFTEEQVLAMQGKKLGMQLYLDVGTEDSNSCAFFHEPMFFERTEPIAETYAIDWASSRENQAIQEMVSQPDGVTFHTFSCKAGEWYYVGAYVLQVVEFKWNVWSKFSKTSQKTVLARMQERNQQADAETALRRGDWQPVGVKLTRNVEEHERMQNELRALIGVAPDME